MVKSAAQLLYWKTNKLNEIKLNNCLFFLSVHWPNQIKLNQTKHNQTQLNKIVNYKIKGFDSI